MRVDDVIVPQPCRRVLCVVNLCEGSHAAATLAQSFAQQHDAELLLLHIVEPPTPEEVMDIGYLRLKTVMEEWQEDAAARLRDLLPHYARMSNQARERVEIGPQADTILDVAREWNADLIVLEVRERSRLSSVLLGSTAKTIVARASVPVITTTSTTATSWKPVRERDYLEAGAAGRGVH